MRRLPLVLLCLSLCVLLALLAACGSELETRGETLRVIETSLDDAFLNEEYSADIRVVGGLTPYAYELTGGQLPPGITLQGGNLRGVPTEEGDFTFTVTVSDGNLSRTFQEYTVNVVVPPPAALTLNVPTTELRRTTLLRAEVTDARDLQAFRSQITWDPALFRLVPDSVEAENEMYALFFEAEEGQLQVDVAVLGGSISGERRVFEFALQPVSTSTLELTTQTEFISDVGGFGFEETVEGLAPADPEDLDDLGDETGGAETGGETGDDNGNDTGGGDTDDDGGDTGGDDG